MVITKIPLDTMIISMMKDPWTGVSVIGMIMFSITQFISTHLNPIVAFVAGCLGLVMLVLGIIEKYYAIQKLRKK